MFNLEEYYQVAECASFADNKEVIDYIKSFSNIIVWGASFLGKAIVKFLKENDINNIEWWDTRAEEIGSVDDIKICMPFPEREQSVKNETLVVFCIGNTAIMSNLLLRLRQNKYTNVLRGDKLFMGAVCSYTKETGIDGLVCNGSMICRSMFCPKLQNIVKERNDKGGLFLPNITFMITSHCSLKCKYCCAYMNSYPTEKKKFFSTEQICRDIDNLFDAVDGVGSITVQGGEPFLHPDIDMIIKKLLEKTNLGIISVATNGIFKIAKEKLSVFKDNRLNVAFSGYYDALPKEKLDIYYANIDMMKENDIPHTVGVKVPEWFIPPTLWDKKLPIDVLKRKKNACKIPVRCMQVVNGRMYPCLFSASCHEIGVADYKEDYIDMSSPNLTDEIRGLMDRPYYQSCSHCHGEAKNTGMAGEQGFYDFVTPQE